MFTCKQVSKALHKEDLQNMPPMRRFFLKFHVKLCVFCGKFNKQVIDSQAMCSCFKENEATLELNREKLEPNQKAALKEKLSNIRTGV